MEYYKIDPQKPDRRIVKRAVEVLKSGGIIVYPTNTLYGLGVDAFNKRALDRLFVIKQRGPYQAVSLLVASLEQLRSLFAKLTPKQYEHLLKILPGKFTILAESRFTQNLPYLSSKFDENAPPKVGFRVAEFPVCKQLSLQLGSPITATSANLTGHPNARTVQDVIAQFGDRLDLILDAGPVRNIKGSTIIDLTKDPYLIVREGAVPVKELKKKLPDVKFKKRKDRFQVTFVCSGNICRSAMAKGILTETVSKTRFKDLMIIDSAGTLPHASGPAHPLTIEVAGAFGIDLHTHQAKPINMSIVEQSDLLIAMAVNHYEFLREHYPEHKEKIVLLKEWHRHTKLANPSIADPIGHDREFFEKTFKEIQSEIKRILPFLFGEVKKFIAYHEIRLGA